MNIVRVEESPKFSWEEKPVLQGDFQVGERYRYFMVNQSHREGQFALEEVAMSRHFTRLVCKPNGEPTLSIKSHDCTNDWHKGGMGQFDLAHVLIEKDYYIVYIDTTKPSSGRSSQYREVPIVIISKILDIKDRDYGFALSDTRYMDVTVETVIREEATDLNKFGVFKTAVNFSLTRQLFGDYTNWGASIPKYSKSLGRVYQTRMFFWDSEERQMVAHDGKRKLILNKRTAIDFEDRREVMPRALIAHIFIAKKLLDDAEVNVDGIVLGLYKPSAYHSDSVKEQLAKKSLVKVTTKTGFTFYASQRKEKVYPLYRSWSGLTEMVLNSYEHSKLESIEPVSLEEFCSEDLPSYGRSSIEIAEKHGYTLS